MHYTALAGTIYYPAQSTEGPPTPLLAAGTLIGIIAAIVVPTCIILFIISAKKSLVNNSILFQKKESHRRLILDTVFFDTNGRMLVKVDGIVPMKEILNALPENVNFNICNTLTNKKIQLFIYNILYHPYRKHMKLLQQATHSLQDYLKQRCNGQVLVKTIQQKKNSTT